MTCIEEMMVFHGALFSCQKTVLTTPAMIAVYLGIPIFLFQINIPLWIEVQAPNDRKHDNLFWLCGGKLGAIIENANIKKALGYTSLYFEICYRNYLLCT